MTVTGSVDLPLASRERDWDGPAAKRRLAEAGRLAEGCFYRDPDGDPQTQVAYKLPFADVIGGTVTAVPQGVITAAGVMQGAMGGVDVPAADRAGIRARIGTYYRRLDLEPPWSTERAVLVRREPVQQMAVERCGLQLAEADATSNLRRLVGRAAPYGHWASRGWYLESFAEGVFAKSTAESAARLPLLLFHEDRRFPVGVAEKWASQPDGLWGEWSLDESPEAQRAAKLARDGGLTGLSVGYAPLRTSWDYTPAHLYDPDDVMTYDRCTRIEARLAEVSLTPTPLFENAQVSHVASTRQPRPHVDRWRQIRDTLAA